MDKINFELISFYKFVPIKDPDKLKDMLFVLCKKSKILGTIIVSKEGVNGMLAGSSTSLNTAISFFSKLGFSIEDFKFSRTNIKPFKRLRIKIREELISLGYVKLSNPNEAVGKYVDPEDWNNLISKKDLVLIDTRNKYETSIGTFNGAILPPMKNFKEFPDFIKNNNISKDASIAMFCTGGIRCEKASAYLLKIGFKDVSHLKGGIIKYLEKVSKEDSKWEGECFVFDNRVSIEQDLTQGNYLNCNGCGNPLRKEEVAHPKYKKGVSCPKCYDNLTKEKIESSSERQKQVELSEKRGEVHIGE
ncbi:rhodanese-related sulfurtransferase [bacterium]|nr:rhodanese-related sulfurtransferase [bacterium]